MASIISLISNRLNNCNHTEDKCAHVIDQMSDNKTNISLHKVLHLYNYITWSKYNDHYAELQFICEALIQTNESNVTNMQMIMTVS